MRTMTRREYLKTAALAPALAAGALASAEASPRLNVLMILVDDLGYGDLGSYGAADMRTPHIDGLIARGMRSNTFYANCPVCSPTRAALLTGRYPDMVGVPGVIRTHRDENWGHLDRDAVLLPEVLRRAGYHTAMSGKWHLGLEPPNTPPQRGFAWFRGFLGDMMDDYYTHRRHDINYMRWDDREVDPEGHATDLFSDWAIDYLNSRKGSDEPFFLYLAYNAPHSPVQPPEAWLNKVLEREPGIDLARAKLVALIEHLDHGIGRVLDALEASGHAENTLVIFTSDNGGYARAGASSGPLRGAKESMYEGGIRVPFAAVWPGRIEPGTTMQGVALTMDLFPTICEVCGVPVEHAIDGVSIADALEGGAPPPADRMLFWMRREGHVYGGRAYYAARQGDWKLVQNTPFEPMQLFNLAEDPAEERPLSEEHEMYQKLFNALRKHVNRSGVVPWQRPSET